MFVSSYEGTISVVFQNNTTLFIYAFYIVTILAIVNIALHYIEPTSSEYSNFCTLHVNTAVCDVFAHFIVVVMPLGYFHWFQQGGYVIFNQKEQVHAEWKPEGTNVCLPQYYICT